VLCLVQAVPLSSAYASSLEDAVRAAWELSPEVQAVLARQGAIQARRKAADSLLPGSPSLGLGYATDRFGGNYIGSREFEAEISTPLWLPGESTANVRVAESELIQNENNLLATQLAVAGEVREAYWAVAQAREASTLAARRLQDTAALAQDLARRVRAGEASRADLLLAESDEAEAQGAMAEQKAAAEEAELAFLQLTGLSVPSTIPEEGQVQASAEQHPLLRARRRAIEVAEAKVRLAKLATRDSPEAGVLVRPERDATGEPYSVTLGVRLRIPFATENRNAPRQAEAESERLEALAQAGAAERQIRAQAERARIALATAAKQLDATEARRQKLQNHLALIERSYRGGEIGFIELVRARGVTYEAELSAVRARIALRRAQSQVNQASGVLPQ